jgi:hypothetical protein
MLARRIVENECSSSPTWLTPNATPDATSNNGSNAGRPATGKSLAKQARGDWPTPVKEDSESRTAHGTSTDAVRDRWPTPTVMDAAGFEGSLDERRTSPNSGWTLLGVVRDWPTPQTTDVSSSARHTTTTGVMHPGTTLTDAARQFPTPAARDYRAPNRLSYRERGGGSKGEQLNNFAAGLHDQENPNTTGSPHASSPRPVLNPRWVAALMGFPVDWLDGVEPPSARSATRSSRKSLKSSVTAS